MRREEYRRALSAQLKSKPIPVSDPIPSEPYFGRNAPDTDKLAVNRQRAQLLYREQLAVAQQAKREAILRQLEEQKREDEMLRRAKEELTLDSVQRYESILQRRASLENNWVQAAEAKKAREREERARNEKFCATLVHEQCGRYRRCQQCKRKLTNVGASNVLPNTRIMV